MMYALHCTWPADTVREEASLPCSSLSGREVTWDAILLSAALWAFVPLMSYSSLLLLMFADSTL